MGEFQWQETPGWQGKIEVIILHLVGNTKTQEGNWLLHTGRIKGEGCWELHCKMRERNAPNTSITKETLRASWFWFQAFTWAGHYSEKRVNEHRQYWHLFHLLEHILPRCLIWIRAFLFQEFFQMALIKNNGKVKIRWNTETRRSTAA